MRVFVLLLAMLFSVSSFPNVIEGPEVAVDFQQNPSDINWRKIESEHFEIIFPQEIEKEASRVAHLLEKAYPFVTRSLEVRPPKIPLILQNQSVDSNGFVTLAPRRSEWYVTPATDPVLTNTEWLKTLAIHEFRHVVQFQKTRRGFNKALEIVLGEIGQALGLGLTLPPWFLEGDAVGIETALTKGGRGRLPLFDRDLRTLLLSGKNWNYDKAHLGSYEDYVPNHYLYGYFYTSWLRNQYGDLFLSKLANQSAETSWNPLSFYNATDTLTGESFETFYQSVMKDLVKEWKERADRLNPTPYTVQNPKKRQGWTNYQYPQVTKTGEILALKSGLSFINRFVLIKGDEERVLFYPGVLHNEYPYRLRNDKFAFFEWEYDPRWGYRNFSRLKVYDLKKERFILDKRKTKGRLAVLNEDASKLIYVEWDPEGDQSLVILNKKGKELRRLPFSKEEVITSIDWLSDEEVVMVIKDQQDFKSLIKFNLVTEARDALVEKTTTNLGYVTVSHGQVMYESPESGIDNIWLYTPDGPRQITSALFGAYAPALSDSKLYYTDYTVDGLNIVQKNLNYQEEQKSQDSFYPIYEKFSGQEGFLDLESELLKEESYKSSRYSQVKNALNLHSWIILAPPLSNTISLTALSRDVLNKFTLTAGGSYNLNEQTLEGFVSAAWTHLYPVFDLRAGYGSRKQDVIIGSRELEDRWEEGTLEAGVQIPWSYIQGRFIHSFSTRAFTRLIKVTNKLSRDAAEVRDGVLYSPGAELSYSVVSRMARRDLNPAWGFSVNLRGEEGKDITGAGQRGSIQSVDSRFYLPGLWYHHSFHHQLAYERQRNDSYEYSSLILYPRGTRSVFLQEFTKYSGNYLMPLFYPDYNLSRYFYLKRISLNLFYDEMNGRLSSFPYRAASYGWEGIFEMNLLRIFLPLSVGVRGSYILEGLERDQNYELFLTSILGTF